MHTCALKDFVKRTVLEGGTYRIQDADAVITLVVDDIKVQRRLVFASFALGSQAPKKLEIEAGKTQLLVLGSKEYAVSVHDSLAPPQPKAMLERPESRET